MSDKQKILIVDDEAINRKTLCNLLEDSYELLVAKDGAQALKRVSDTPSIDLILLDVMMPEMDGYEVLRRLKQNNSDNIPVIFITSKSSVEDEERGLKLGAVDYINKPFHPTIVKLRLENHLQSVSQRKLLELMVGYDGLTGIANRRQFDETLYKEWLRSRRDRSPLSLAMIDIDYFKPFNDNYGHAEGDIALKAVAKALSGIVQRSPDLVARYGGEEFVLLLPDTDAVGGKLIAEKALASIERQKISHAFSNASEYVTASIGGATLTASDGPPETLVKIADKYLYRAKEEGRNRVIWCD